MYAHGEPVHGEKVSTDASAGVAIPIYNEGSTTARTLGADEYIEVHEVQVSSVAAGLTIVSFGATNPGSSPTAGNRVVSAALPINGSIQMSHVHAVGPVGATLWLTAPAGDSSHVTLKATIRSATANNSRPKWMESLTPGV